MAIVVQCVHCGQRYRLSDDLAGKQAKCKCGQILSVPGAAAAAADNQADVLGDSAARENEPAIAATLPGFVPPGQQVPLSKQARERASPTWRWLALGGVGTLSVIAVIAAIWLFFRENAPESGPQQQLASGQSLPT
jgi:hypothetical protein